jgi:hypothetical protein
MTPDGVFQAANLFAMLGWLSLAAGVIWRRPMWRDTVAGRIFPLALSGAYLLLIVFFFGRAEGGFGSLEGVQKLFAAPWVVVAGWLHYLVFDLFVGAWIAKQAASDGLPRWPLVIFLPLTLMFGPIGFLAYHAARPLLSTRID